MKSKTRRLTAAALSIAVGIASATGTGAGVIADAAYGNGGNGTAIMEYLDRGIYAIKSGNGMFVSWRYNANDDNGAEFRLYRDNELIYTSTGNEATSYWDNGGTSGSLYKVETVRDGKVINSQVCSFTSGTNYFEIPLRKPAGNYMPNDCAVGDVDGDGQYEIFLKWDPDNSQDNSKGGVTDNVYIDCLTLDGRQLWRVDLGRNIRAGQHYTQMCVADFDCDGKAELITRTSDGTKDGTGQTIGDGSKVYINSDGYVLSGPEYLTLFEGATGKALDTIDFPVSRGNVADWGDKYGNRVDRFNGAIAYLDGVHPSAVYGRGYYTRLTLSAVDVRDGKLVKRWIFDSGFDSSNPAFGNGNHNIMTADVDNDGKQEICMGASMIDDNGTLLWCTKTGHGDAMHLGDLDPDREGQELWICHESGNYGVSLVDTKNGSIIFHKDGDKDTGRCCADNVFAGNRGAEFWGSRPAYTVMNSQGNQISMDVPAMNFLIYWDGDLERELLDGTEITGINENGKIEKVFSADGCVSNNGTKSVPCLTADIFGDWREELVLSSSDGNSLRVCCTDYRTDVRITTLMHDMQYRMQAGCEQSCYNQPPHPSFFLGTGYELPARPSVALNGGPQEPVNGRYVKDLQIIDSANRSSWQLAESNSTGGAVYGDRDFTYTSLPQSVDGCEYIGPACNSKNSSGDLAQFTAGEDIAVYVLVDKREEEAGSVPSWLSSWERTGDEAQISNDVVFAAYRKTFKEGETVLLGNNGMTGNVVNYTVFVKADEPAPTEPPTEPPTDPPTEPPTEEPTAPPTDAPTDPPTDPPTEPPTDAPTDELTYGNVMYGDANCDGKINVADAVAILQYIANQTKYPLTPEGLNNADVFYRGDGITGSDAISIQKMDAGVLTSLPESYQQ
ncbi:MAG: hypothetical protein J5501_01115 [Ruminococcus sp.]|nr:hypothetical protein [Ruminococcus sp.]